MNGRLIEALRGPLMLIALGAMFAADQMEVVPFSRTWPALLILFGMLKLAEQMSAGRRRFDKPPEGGQGTA